MRRRQTMRKWSEAAWLGVVVVVSTSLFFRRQLANGFTVLFGNYYDAVISAAIEEHWYGVFQGKQAWNRPPWFAPHPDTLGYNDGLVLFGPPYTLFRLIGCDPFLAAELVNMVFHAGGVVALFLLARRTFGFGPKLALLGAALFGVAGNMALQGDHAQLFTVSLFPLLMLLLWHALRDAGAGRRWRVAVWGCLAALLFDAWLLTSFYAAWLSALFLMLQAVALISGFAVARRGRELVRPDLLWPLATIACVGAIGISPFLVVYLPKVSETGLHDTAEIFSCQPRPIDLLNPHLMGGLMAGPWHWLETRLSSAKPVDPTGYAPLLLALALCGLLATLADWRCESPGSAARRSLAVSTPIAIVLLVTPAGWDLVLDFVPGARGLRDIARFLLVLTVPLVLLSLCALEWLSAWLSRRGLVIGSLVAFAVLAEEVATPLPVALDGRAGREWLRSIPRTPDACRSFFVTGYEHFLDVTRPLFQARHNVDAMLVSAIRSLPTPNGIATFNPPDWDFRDADSPDYPVAMGRYLSAHDLGTSCRLDLPTSSWQVAPRLPKPIVPLDVDVALGADDQAGSGVFLSGWDPQEPTGRWTDRKRSVLRFLLPGVAPATPLRVSLTMSALVRPGSGQVDPVEIRTGGIDRARFEVDAKRRTYVLQLPWRPSDAGDAVSIELLQSTLRTPESLGMGVDRRELGLFVSALKIESEAAQSNGSSGRAGG